MFPFYELIRWSPGRQISHDPGPRGGVIMVFSTSGTFLERIVFILNISLGHRFLFSKRERAGGTNFIIVLCFLITA